MVGSEGPVETKDEGCISRTIKMHELLQFVGPLHTMLLLPFADLTQSVSFAVFLALGEHLHAHVRLLLLLLLTTQIALLLLELALMG